MSAVEITVDDVRHVGELANLELTAEELPAMARNLQAVLGYVAQLNELETSDVLPMAQVEEALGGERFVSGEKLRADVLKPSVDRGTVMAEAPESDGRFFKVPKVIER